VSRAIPLAGLTTLLATFPLIVAAYREGPAPAMTGGFGEKTCHTCHFDNPLNAKGGWLRVDGVPPGYTPGQEYAISVLVHRAGIKRAGFELAVRFTGGAAKGQQAGTLRAPDARTQIISAPGGSIRYIQHTKLGSDLVASAEGRWTIEWTAPAAPASAVVFHVAGNAANDDASPLGDFIYTTTVTSRPNPRN